MRGSRGRTHDDIDWTLEYRLRLAFDDGLSFKGLPWGGPTSLVTPEFADRKGSFHVRSCQDAL